MGDLVRFRAHQIRKSVLRLHSISAARVGHRHATGLERRHGKSFLDSRPRARGLLEGHAAIQPRLATASIYALDGAKDSVYGSPVLRPLHTVSVGGPVPASQIVSPTLVYTGCRIRFLGRTWTVDRINYHPRFGDFFALTAEDDGSYELIGARGCDGQYEVLEG